MGDLLSISGNVDFLASPQLPSVVSRAIGPGGGGMLFRELDTSCILYIYVHGFFTVLLTNFLKEELLYSF